MHNTFRCHVSLLFLLSSLFFVGCSTQSSSSDKSVRVQELTLFMSRRALSGTEFEQYKLGNNGSLYIECGKIVGGRFAPSFQKMSKILDENQIEINQALGKAMETKKYQRASFDDPGTNSSFFDPGKYELSFVGELIEPLNTDASAVNGDIKTSLDSVVDPKSETEREFLKIATAIRSGVSFYEPICNNRDFYGIPGREYPNSKWDALRKNS